MTYTLEDIKKYFSEIFYIENDSILDILIAIAISAKNLKSDAIWLLIVGPPSGGKCTKFNTPIIMYDGSIKMSQDIKQGDLLMGDDSTSRTVLSIARGRDIMYRVDQQYGDSYTVNSEHILSLKRTRGSNKGKVIDIPIKEYIKKSNTLKKNYNGFKVGVEFKKRKVLLDPYFLGLWLGDGRRTSTEITKPDKEIEQYLESFAKSVDMNLSRYHTIGRCKSFAITGKKSRKQNKIESLLCGYGLMPKKFIPNDYKINSREIRLQILAGLMDTDGYLSEGTHYDFISKDKQLAEDVVFLSRSLGLHASVNKCKKGIKSTGFMGTYYRVYISGNIEIIPTKIKRKIAIKHKRRTDELSSGIKITKLNKDNYYGFTLDGNGRFLLGDFTVTHNTELVNVLSGLEYAHQVSTLTENALLSGMGGSDGKEKSLLHKIGSDGAVLCMKDFTSILSLKEELRKKILADLREVYEGHLVKATGNGKDAEWGPGAKLNFVGAVTDAIYMNEGDDASMGRRTIDYIMPEFSQEVRIKMAKRASQNIDDIAEKRENIKNMFATFIVEKQIGMPKVFPPLPDELIDELISIADFSTKMRTATKRDFHGNLTFAPGHELPTRMNGQFMTLAKVLIWLNDGTLKKEHKDIMVKMALDSISQQRRVTLRMLAKYDRVTTKGCAQILGYPTKTVLQWLEDINVTRGCTRIVEGYRDFWIIDKGFRELLLKYNDTDFVGGDLIGDESYDAHNPNGEYDPALVEEMTRNQKDAFSELF